MTRLVKMLRLYRDRKKIVKNIDKVLKISAGVERLYFFVVIFFLFNHIISCLWVFVAQFDENTSWVISQLLKMKDSGELPEDAT